MRKFILFFVATIFVMAGYSQNRSTTLANTTYYHEFSLAASDTIIASDTLLYQITLNKFEPVRLQMQVDMDSISGSGHDTLFLQGRVFGSDAWTAIDTAVYAHTGTGINTLANISSDMYYRQVRLFIKSTSAAGKNKVVAIRTKVWKLH